MKRSIKISLIAFIVLASAKYSFTKTDTLKNAVSILNRQIEQNTLTDAATNNNSGTHWYIVGPNIHPDSNSFGGYDPVIINALNDRLNQLHEEGIADFYIYLDNIKILNSDIFTQQEYQTLLEQRQQELDLFTEQLFEQSNLGAKGLVFSVSKFLYFSKEDYLKIFYLNSLALGAEYSPLADQMKQKIIDCGDFANFMKVDNSEALRTIVKTIISLLTGEEYELPDGLVTFGEAHNPNYGFDKYKYQPLWIFYEHINIGETEYHVPWKAIEMFQSDNVYADISGNLGSSLTFTSDYGTLPPPTAVPDNDSLNLSLTGKADGDIENITATYTDQYGETVTVGKLRVKSYEPVDKELIIVPINGNTLEISNINDIQTYINNVYKQAAVKWTVTLHDGMTGVEFNENDDPRLDDETTIFTAYTKEMRNIIDSYEEFNNTTDKTYVLFLMHSSEKGKAGFMPLKKHYGFIFMDEFRSSNPTELHRTVSHEVAHGAFVLYHTFSAFPALQQATTDNLMDYATGTHLCKYQWDLIHDPVWLIVGGGSEEEGAMNFFTDPLLIYSPSRKYYKYKVAFNCEECFTQFPPYYATFTYRNETVSLKFGTTHELYNKFGSKKKLFGKHEIINYNNIFDKYKIISYCDNIDDISYSNDFSPKVYEVNNEKVVFLTTDVSFIPKTQCSFLGIIEDQDNGSKRIHQRIAIFSKDRIKLNVNCFNISYEILNLNYLNKIPENVKVNIYNKSNTIIFEKEDKFIGLDEYKSNNAMDDLIDDDLIELMKQNINWDGTKKDKTLVKVNEFPLTVEVEISIDSKKYKKESQITCAEEWKKWLTFRFRNVHKQKFSYYNINKSKWENAINSEAMKQAPHEYLNRHIVENARFMDDNIGRTNIVFVYLLKLIEKSIKDNHPEDYNNFKNWLTNSEGSTGAGLRMSAFNSSISIHSLGYAIDVDDVLNPVIGNYGGVNTEYIYAVIYLLTGENLYNTKYDYFIGKEKYICDTHNKFLSVLNKIKTQEEFSQFPDEQKKVDFLSASMAEAFIGLHDYLELIEKNYLGNCENNYRFINLHNNHIGNDLLHVYETYKTEVGNNSDATPTEIVTELNNIKGNTVNLQSQLDNLKKAMFVHITYENEYQNLQTYLSDLISICDQLLNILDNAPNSYVNIENFEINTISIYNAINSLSVIASQTQFISQLILDLNNLLLSFNCKEYKTFSRKVKQLNKRKNMNGKGIFFDGFLTMDYKFIDYLVNFTFSGDDHLFSSLNGKKPLGWGGWFSKMHDFMHFEVRYVTEYDRLFIPELEKAIKEAKVFQLTETSLENLRKEDIPESTIDKIKDLKDTPPQSFSAFKNKIEERIIGKDDTAKKYRYRIYLHSDQSLKKIVEAINKLGFEQYDTQTGYENGKIYKYPIRK